MQYSVKFVLYWYFLIVCAEILKGKLYCYIKRQVISNTSNFVQTCRDYLSTNSRKVHRQNAWDSFINLCISLSVKAFSPSLSLLYSLWCSNPSSNTEKCGLTFVVSVAHVKHQVLGLLWLQEKKRETNCFKTLF